MAETLVASARHRPTPTSSFVALCCPNCHYFECCWHCLCWSPIGGPIGWGGGGLGLGRWVGLRVGGDRRVRGRSEKINKNKNKEKD